MMRRNVWYWITLYITLLSIGFPVSAQEATPEVADAFDWPLPYPTEDQLDEARLCDQNLDSLMRERYGADMAEEDFGSAYEPETACDWAVLAAAYSQRADEEVPPTAEAQIAFMRAVELNPAIPYLLPLLFGYFGQVNFIAAPDFTENAITSVDIEYSYGGMGGINVDYRIRITDADTEPVVRGEVTTWGANTDGAVDESISLPETVDSDLVQALDPAMTDLLPSETLFTQRVCYDNYPDWTVRITFADEREVTFVTNESNIVNPGGPWQATIDEKYYMQYSSAMLTASMDIITALELPFGTTVAMTCGGLSTTPLDDAFPPESFG
jgi:hypothetical protein